MKWFCGLKLLHILLVFGCSCILCIQNKQIFSSVKFTEKEKANLFTIYELECLRLKEAVTTYKDVLGEITPRCVC